MDAIEAIEGLVAGGAGIRYRLTAEGATLRGDDAVADAGPEIYVLLLEAF